MAYTERLLRLASERIEQRRRNAEEAASLRHDSFVKAHPELIRLEDKMRKSAFGLVKVIGMGEKTAEYIEKLRDENLAAQRQINSLLLESNYPEDYLEPDYTCKICSDTGFKDGRLCKCHLELLKQLSYEQLCEKSPLKLSSFDEFSLDFYKYDEGVYDLMSRNFFFCKNYADSFDLNSDSVIMWGETGLGKTHLSLAIAGETIKKGFGVVYGSVQNLFGDVEKEHFGRSDFPDGTTEKMLLECDLLILDDLGAEFTTNFTVAVLNNVINTRLLASKPTVISTNLNMNELVSKYSRRIASRIIGEYKILTFDGRDIRQQKLGI